MQEKIYSVIKRPVVSEKSTAIGQERCVDGAVLASQLAQPEGVRVLRIIDGLLHRENLRHTFPSEPPRERRDGHNVSSVVDGVRGDDVQYRTLVE